MQGRNNNPSPIHVSSTTAEFLFSESHISEVNTPILSPVGECLIPTALENWLVGFEVSYKTFQSLEKTQESLSLGFTENQHDINRRQTHTKSKIIES